MSDGQRIIVAGRRFHTTRRRGAVGSAVALVEPWACVETLRIHGEDPSKTGGHMLVVADVKVARDALPRPFRSLWQTGPVTWVSVSGTGGIVRSD
jgi:hypothetical protein